MEIPHFQGGQICKKQIFFLLRPELKAYRTETVRKFFTHERLQRCGITPDEFPSIRIFSPDATCIIVSELQRLNFLK